MRHEKFAVLILSHGRADNMKTLKALNEQGYTGRWYIVIDNEDASAKEYYARFGQDHVIMFDKLEAAKRIDIGDNFPERNVVVIARNVCHDIAASLGLEYFLELDDDYVSFDFRYIEGDKLKASRIKNLDLLFDYMLDFLDESGAVTVAFAQAGDYIGGAESGTFKKGLLRKAMNSFFCRTDRPFKFFGRINEDVNAYVKLGSEGKLFFSICDVGLIQTETQQSSGGLTEAYLDLGTYVKSYYSVMYCPSCVKIGIMGGNDYRIHHQISWRNAVPQILDEKWKKESS